MYTRKVRLKEYMHHTNATTYASGSTAQLIGSTADNWTVAYASNVGKVSSPDTATANYLTNYVAHAVDNHQIYECSITPTAGIDEDTSSSDQGVGFVFRASANATSFASAYRLRQTGTHLYLEKTTDSGVNWTELGQYDETAAVSTRYYYRVIYAATAMTVYGVATNLTAGKFMVYRTTVPGVFGSKLTNVSGTGTEVDASPLIAGGFMGPFAGSADASPDNPEVDCWYMGAFKMFDPDVRGVKVSDKLSETSTLSMSFSRNPDTLQGTWTSSTDSSGYGIGDRIECIAIQDDPANSRSEEVTIFDGRVEVLPVMGEKVLGAKGWTVELEDMHWREATTQTGAVTTELATLLVSDSGIIANQAGTTTATYVLHDLDITADAQTTERVIQASNAFVVFNQLCGEIGYWFSFRPDCRFLVKSDMENMAAHTIDATDSDHNILFFQALYDGNQIKNVVSEYYTGWAAPGSSTDATSLGNYGVRNGILTDMFVQSSTVAGNIGGNKIAGLKDNLRIVKVQMIMQGFDIFPGDRVDVILAGTELGTNDYDADTNNWSAARMTCTEKSYNSLDGVVHLVLTRADDASDTAYSRNWISSGDGRGAVRTQSNLYALHA